jgi:hypothetical protein
MKKKNAVISRQVKNEKLGRSDLTEPVGFLVRHQFISCSLIFDKSRVVTGTFARGDAFLPELAKSWSSIEVIDAE